MPYSEELAQRIRAELEPRDGVSERKMFGGLCFMVNGHIACCASRTGGMLVRVDPEEAAAATAQAHVAPMEMRGRTMKGFLNVDVEVLADEADLARWIDTGANAAAALPD